jgi:hypothetical protein
MAEELLEFETITRSRFIELMGMPSLVSTPSSAPVYSNTSIS